MMYNLEFKLLLISEYIHLLINPKALDIYSSKEALVKVLTHHEAITYSKIHHALL
jgi:hypothetical protein